MSEALKKQTLVSLAMLGTMVREARTLVTIDSIAEVTTKPSPIPGPSFYTLRCREIGQQVNALLKDDKFREACDTAGIKPTRRQARKWLRRQGLAYRTSSTRVDS